MICRVERTRYATLDALEVTDRFTATPGALEADIQICLEQLKRVAPPDALEATEKLQTCPVRLKRAATQGVLEATDRLVLCD